jgi:Flp pilus assembly pilin Flp
MRYRLSRFEREIYDISAISVGVAAGLISVAIVMGARSFDDAASSAGRTNLAAKPDWSVSIGLGLKAQAEPRSLPPQRP